MINLRVDVLHFIQIDEFTRQKKEREKKNEGKKSKKIFKTSNSKI
jgi:hypothetical protein